MRNDYLPRRDAALWTWAWSFTAQLLADPEAFGVSPQQAAAVSEASDAYSVALQAAYRMDTRGPSRTHAKNAARATLERIVRQTAAIVQASPVVTPQQISDLGLTVRAAGGSPRLAPSNAPRVLVRHVRGNTIRLRLRDSEVPTRRGKAEGAYGASVFRHVGNEPPAAQDDWTYCGSTTRTTYDVSLPAGTPPGTRVWFAAVWLNATLQPGPRSDAVDTWTQFGPQVAPPSLAA